MVVTDSIGKRVEEVCKCCHEVAEKLPRGSFFDLEVSQRQALSFLKGCKGKEAAKAIQALEGALRQTTRLAKAQEIGVIRLVKELGRMMTIARGQTNQALGKKADGFFPEPKVTNE